MRPTLPLDQPIGCGYYQSASDYCENQRNPPCDSDHSF